MDRIIMHMLRSEKILDIIEKRFTISLEVVPPRNGSSFNKMTKQLMLLASQDPDFISVTKGAGGSLRGGSLPIAHFIQHHIMTPALAHFTCRDYTIEEVENALIDHHYFGINNILALRGDPPAGSKDYASKPGSYPYAYKLVEHIVKLNKGFYLTRPGFDENIEERLVKKEEATDFCIGVACYPEFDDFNLGVEYLQKKVDSGAHFAITQMIFDIEAYCRYRDHFKIPILPGLHSLISLKQCEFLKNHMGIIPPKNVEYLLEEKGRMVDYMIQLIEDLKKEGAPGIHLFVITNFEDTIHILRSIG